MNKIDIIGTKETLYVEQLNNGLNIYMLPNKNVKNFYITLNTIYGSIYTKYKIDGKNYNDPKGIAHYLEHLMFNMPNEDVFEYYSKLGSSINAHTSHDITGYEVFANSKFKENLGYLLEYVYTPYFTKELINNERGIIEEEIKMYEDDPTTSLVHNLFENIFINDEHRYLISGKVQDIKEIKLEDIKRTYETFYHPKNMFVVITGNFNPEEAVAIISEKMKKIDFPTFNEPNLKIISEPFKVNKEYNVIEANVNKSKAAIGFKIPKNNFKSLKLSKLELKIYINIIMKVNFGSSSLINEEMRSNAIVNSGIDMDFLETAEYFVICFYGDTDYIDYFTRRIKETFDNLEINKDSFQRKIKTEISDFLWLFDDVESVNNEISDNIIDYGYVVTDLYNIYKTLNKEIADKVLSKLNKYLFSISIVKTK